MSEEQILDLDAVAAEVEPRKVRVGGKIFVAPGDVTVTQARAWQALSGRIAQLVDDDLEGAFELMERFLAGVFGDEHAAELMGLCTLEQLVQLVTGVTKWYGLDGPGKALGSSEPSPRAGGRSKPTSKGSTRSTSKQRASGRPRSPARG